MKKQFNLNSALITVVGVLLAFGLRKLDDINTKTITLGTAQSALVERLERIEKDMVMRAEFRSEIDRLEAKIAKAAKQ